MGIGSLWHAQSQTLVRGERRVGQNHHQVQSGELPRLGLQRAEPGDLLGSLPQIFQDADPSRFPAPVDKAAGDPGRGMIGISVNN